MEQKRNAFFGLGLLVTSSLCLAAFSYQDASLRDDEQKYKSDKRMSMEFELVPVEMEKEEPIVDQKPPEVQTPPTPTVAAVQQVTQDIKVTTSTSKIPKPSVVVDLGSLSAGKKDVVYVAPGAATEVFEFADIDAEYIGGRAQMEKFIQTKVVYPQFALEMNGQGKSM